MRSMYKNTRKSFGLFEKMYEGDFHGLKELTGYVDIDSQISGLHRGDLVVVTGEPGSGKTSLLANVALNIADRPSQKILFYSLQFPAEQLIFRMICVQGRTSAHEAIRGYIPREDWHAMTSAAGILQEAPIFIEDGETEGIEAMLKKIRRRHEKIPDLKLIIIDSIDMLAGSDMAQYADCLRKLKAAAVGLRIPVVLSASIPIEQRKSKNCPSQGRIQTIQTYADTVMHIRLDSGDYFARYNDIYRRMGGDASRRQKLLQSIPEIYMAIRAEIAVIKNTYGPKGSIFLTFIPQQFRFESDATHSQTEGP